MNNSNQPNGQNPEMKNEQQTAQSVKPFSAQTRVDDEFLVESANLVAMCTERLELGLEPTPLMLLKAVGLHEKLREHYGPLGSVVDVLTDEEHWLEVEDVYPYYLKDYGWKTKIEPADILRPETEQERMNEEYLEAFEEVAPIIIRRMLRHVLEMMVPDSSKDSEEFTKEEATIMGANLLAKELLLIASLSALAAEGMMTGRIIGKSAYAGEHTFIFRDEETGASHILRPLSGEQEMFCLDRMGRRVTLGPVETDYDLNEISAWWITPPADGDEKNGEETPKEETSESADTDTLKFTPQGRAHEMPGIVFKAINLQTSALTFIRPKDDVQERMLSLYYDMEMTGSGIHVDDDGVWECETLAA